MKIYICAIGAFSALLIIFISSCKEKGQYSDSLSCSNIDSLKSKNFNDSFVFASPKALFVFDSLLIVCDTRCGDNLFYIFNKNSGEFLKTGGEKGEGPGELLSPGKPHLDKDGFLSYWDVNKSKVITYDLKKIVANNKNTQCFSELAVRKGDTFTSYLDVLPLANTYLYNGNNNKHLGIGGSESYSSCPELPEISSEEERWSIMNYSHLALSPNQKYAVQATSIGGIVQGFEIGKNEIKEKFLKLYFPPQYKLVKGVKPAWIKWYDESRMGFDNICATDNHVFLLLNGKLAKEKPFSNEVLVMNWDGEIEQKYVLDKTVKAISIDEKENAIYAISISFDSEPKLIRYEM